MSEYILKTVKLNQEVALICSVNSSLEDPGDGYQLPTEPPPPDNPTEPPPPDYATGHPYVYATCLLISSVLLLITSVIYLLLPELRCDLQGKCVLYLVLSLMLGCFFLAMIQLLNVTDGHEKKCIFFAMSTLFWLLCAFFWLSINCYNFYRSVVLERLLMSDPRLMLFYHIAGWGFPALLLVFALATHHIPGDHIRPNFGVDSCWFQGQLERWVYFYTPVAILLSLNLIIFISAAYMLWGSYHAPNQLPTVKVLRFRFFLYLKLFLAMGITWIFEVLSVLCGSPWYVTNVINCLYGVAIFFVMIAFRKRVWYLMAKKQLCGLHNMNCWGPLADEETLDGNMEQQTGMMDETRTYSFVENGSKQH